MAAPAKLISTSVGFQDGKGNLAALAFLSLQLEFASEVIATGGQVTNQALLFPLDSSAKITTTAIWFSDELSGSPRYRAILYASNGSTIIQDFGFWSITGASANLSLMTPSATGGSFIDPVIKGPSTSQTVTQPAGTSLNVNGLMTIARGSSTSPYMLQLVDSTSINNQVIGFNVEQETNPSSSAAWISFAQAVELFSPIGNTQTFPVDFVGSYGSCSHFGSGAIANMHGGDFEAFNSGPATATLVVGCAATSNNGGTATGSPVQTPTNNGIATNLRAFDGICKNLSSGTVTNAEVFYAEGITKPGGGTITNAWGLLVADQTVATNNFAIQTGLGKVSFGDQTTLNAITGIGTAPDAARCLFVAGTPTGLAGSTQVGVQSSPTTSSASTVEGAGLYVRADTANAAYVQALNTGVHVLTPTKGAASTITEWNGIRIEASPTAGSAFAIKTVGTDPILFNGSVTQQTPNGAQWIQGQASESLTLSTSGTTTDTSANLLPANSIIEAVVARVTTTITTATDWKLGDGTISGRFAAANTVMTAGSTSVGTVQADQTGTSGPRQAAAAKLRVTTTGTPGAGVIRITVFYRQFVPPTS